MYKILLSDNGMSDAVYLENPEDLISFAENEIEKRRVEKYICELRLDPDTRSVYNGEKLSYLPPKDYEMLEYLEKNRGRLITYGELYANVWQADGGTDEHAIAVCIHRLRSKIEPDSKKPIFIRNVWGVGYRYM